MESEKLENDKDKPNTGMFRPKGRSPTKKYGWRPVGSFPTRGETLSVKTGCNINPKGGEIEEEEEEESHKVVDGEGKFVYFEERKEEDLEMAGLLDEGGEELFYDLSDSEFGEERKNSEVVEEKADAAYFGGLAMVVYEEEVQTIILGVDHVGNRCLSLSLQGDERETVDDGRTSIWVL